LNVPPNNPMRKPGATSGVLTLTEPNETGALLRMIQGLAPARLMPASLGRCRARHT